MHDAFFGMVRQSIAYWIKFSVPPRTVCSGVFPAYHSQELMFGWGRHNSCYETGVSRLLSEIRCLLYVCSISNESQNTLVFFLMQFAPVWCVGSVTVSPFVQIKFTSLKFSFRLSSNITNFSLFPLQFWIFYFLISFFNSPQNFPHMFLQQPQNFFRFSQFLTIFFLTFLTCFFSNPNFFLDSLNFLQFFLTIPKISFFKKKYRVKSKFFQFS